MPPSCLSISSEAAQGFRSNGTCPRVLWVRRLLWAHHHLHAGRAGGPGAGDLGWQSHRAGGPLHGRKRKGSSDRRPGAEAAQCHHHAKGVSSPCAAHSHQLPFLLGNHPWLCCTVGEAPITCSMAMMRILSDEEESPTRFLCSGQCSQCRASAVVAQFELRGKLAVQKTINCTGKLCRRRSNHQFYHHHTPRIGVLQLNGHCCVKCLFQSEKAVYPEPSRRRHSAVITSVINSEAAVERGASTARSSAGCRCQARSRQ